LRDGRFGALIAVRVAHGAERLLDDDRGAVGLGLRASDEVRPGVALVLCQRPDGETLVGTIDLPLRSLRRSGRSRSTAGRRSEPLHQAPRAWAVQGTGTLVTASGGTAGANNITLGGAVGWQNSGTVDELGLLTIGDASFDVATFTNEKGGIYDFLTNDGIGIGAVSTSSFINRAGAVLEKTAGTGNSQINVAVVNDGTVTLDTGTITFEQAVSGTGRFTIAPGTVLAFAAGVAASSSVDFATTAGRELFLGDSDITTM
jgi:hypothetical protein